MLGRDVCNTCDREGVIINNINNLGTGKKNTTQNIGQKYTAHREQIQTANLCKIIYVC